MSLAYYIVLEDPDVDFDPFVDGKAVAAIDDQLLAFCRRHDLKAIEDFYSQNPEDLLDEIEEVDMPEQEEVWFSAKAGVSWLNRLLDVLDNTHAPFADEAVIEDLEGYLSVLELAAEAGVRWHFEMDF